MPADPAPALAAALLSAANSSSELSLGSCKPMYLPSSLPLTPHGMRLYPPPLLLPPPTTVPYEEALDFFLRGDVREPDPSAGMSW
jgi:hypothetical protein